MGQLCCTSIHLNSKLFYWGLWHFTTVIMQNLTSCVLLVALGECALLLAFESTLFFELKRGHMHKDQDLSFISASCMVKKVSTTRESNCAGKITVYVMEGSKAMAKSSTTRASLSSFQSTRWRGVSDLQKIKKAQMPMSSKTKTRQQFIPIPVGLFWSNIFLRRSSCRAQEKEESFLRNKLALTEEAWLSRRWKLCPYT